VGIVDEDIARVREATDASAIIGEVVALRRQGNRLVGLCPFHSEKTPSFSVNAVEGLYYCFGCQARGDLITFVRETQHVDFAGAVEFLAGRAGIALRYDSPGATRDHRRKSELTEAMEAAVEWYHQRLLVAPDAGPARGYLRSRGYDKEVLTRFKLGWAPDGWDSLCRALPFSADVLRDTGLAFTNRSGRQMDAFRARVTFPIFDAAGKPVAFGARILPGAEGPKYKNSQEGPLYSKRRMLYGLNWAKADIVTRGEVIVCEGYTDVIAFHRAGLSAAVATCGTALADEHMALLKNFTRRIVLAYDADSAGQGAAERFYAWEQKLDLDIHVLHLPDGADPGSTDASTLSDAVASARPFLAFRVDRIMASGTRSAEGRARTAEAALAAIAVHPSSLVRDQYVMSVADQTRMPADQLRARLEEIRRDPSSAPARPLLGNVTAPRPGVEVEALRLAIHRPEEVAAYLEDVLFHDPVHLEAFQALLSAPTLRDAIDHAGPASEPLLLRLAVEEPDPAIVADDIVALLVRAAAMRAVSNLEVEARATGQVEVYVASMGWAKERIEALMDEQRRIDAATQLVAWLCDLTVDDGEKQEHAEKG
jgi:DNA primase